MTTTPNQRFPNQCALVPHGSYRASWLSRNADRARRRWPAVSFIGVCAWDSASLPSDFGVLGAFCG